MHLGLCKHWLCSGLTISDPHTFHHTLQIQAVHQLLMPSLMTQLQAQPWPLSPNVPLIHSILHQATCV